MAVSDVQTSTSPFFISSSSYTATLINNPNRDSTGSAMQVYTSTLHTSHLSSTARRLARKRAGHIHHLGAHVHPTPSAAATDVRGGSSPSSSLSPSPPAASYTSPELVSLGTIDFKTIVRSLGHLPDPPHHHHHQRSTSKSKSKPSSSLANTAAAAASSSGGSTPTAPTTTLPNAAKPAATIVAHPIDHHQPLFRIPPRPIPTPSSFKLALFHPHNTRPLPEISRPTLLVVPAAAAGPAEAPARRSSARARKPTAKAHALSLGLATDGSALDHHHHQHLKEDGLGVVTTAAAPKKSHKSKAQQAAAAAAALARAAAEEATGEPTTTTTTTRRAAAPKRKVTAVIDEDQHLGDARMQSPSPSPAKRPRRGVVAEAAAPSPLSNEIARGESTNKKRKVDHATEDAREDSVAAAEGGPNPSKSKAAAKAQGGRSKSRKSALTTNKLVIEESQPPTPIVREPSTGENVDCDEGSGEQAMMEEVEEERVGFRRHSINIFEDPLELKPRPRPVYKTHLKRSSSGSAGGGGDGGDKPARPRKSRKSTREDSKQTTTPPVTTNGSVEAPEKTTILEPESSTASPDSMEVDQVPVAHPPLTIVASPATIKESQSEPVSGEQ